MRDAPEQIAVNAALPARSAALRYSICAELRRSTLPTPSVLVRNGSDTHRVWML